MSGLSNLVFWVTVGSALLGIVLFFLLRAHFKKIRLPTLRVLDFEKSRLRRFKLQVPSWVPFIIFLLSTLVFLFFSGRPLSMVEQENKPVSMRVHILLDLSPSVSRYVTIPQYVQHISDIWQGFNGKAKVSLTTTHSSKVYFPATLEEMQEIIYALGFHRGGIDLGSVLKQQLVKIGNTDIMLICSDANQSSWQKLNWKYLTEEMKVFWVDLRKPNTVKDNILFRSIHLLSTPFDPSLDWNIELERYGDYLPNRRGLLKVLQGSETLLSVPWQFDENQQKLVVNASLPAAKLSQLETKDDNSLVWQLEPYEADLINLDNTFRTPLKGLRQDALLVGEPSGEMELEDPFYHIRASLETFGFIPQRIDHWDETLIKKKYPFWIVAIDDEVPIQETCPLTLGVNRLKRKIDDPQAKDEFFPLVWLMTTQVNSQLRNLCSCFYNLVAADKIDNTKVPERCEGVSDRESLSEAMQVVGAERIGGSISSAKGAVAWFKEDKDLGFGVAAFTIPLKPNRKLHIDHASFPLMIKELLQWHQLLEGPSLTRRNLIDWPRVLDLSQLAGWKEGDYSAAVKDSNIPVEASILVDIDQSTLPPIWERSQDLMTKNYVLKKTEEDPSFWLNLCVGLLLTLMLLDILWNWRRKLPFRKILFKIFLFAVMIDVLRPSKLNADINLSVIGEPYANSISFLSREISSRTSIEMSEKVLYFDDDPKVLQEPWYWVRKTSLITDSNGFLRENFRYWLKRGGFLVLQGFRQSDLEKMTARGFSQDVGDKPHWQAIPPDHELMRSFYLLDALPTCGEQVWYGFFFDHRLAILAIPFDFLESLGDTSPASLICGQSMTALRKIRYLINIVMVPLTTDYKKEQIHMREVLKRLR